MTGLGAGHLARQQLGRAYYGALLERPSGGAGQLTSLRMYEPPKVEVPKPEPLTASCWLK
jgi:hypothetical protein